MIEVRPARLASHCAWLAAAVLLLNLASAGAAQPPANPSASATTGATTSLEGAERVLAAIREALVERALEAPTRVLSLGWIDAAGTLHETTQFRTDARVRGVRVLGYFDDEGEATRPRLSAEIDIPASLRAVTGAQTCTDAPTRWRIPVALRPVEPDARGQEHGIARALSTALIGLLLANDARLARWTLVRGQGAVESSYAKALSGRITAAPDWTLALSVQPLDMPRASWLEPVVRLGSALVPALAGQGLSWRVELTLQRAGDAAEALRIEETIAIDDRMGSTTDQVARHLVQRLPAWLTRLDQQAVCESPHYALLRRAPDEWAIGAGESTGLRPGDRVLVVDRRSVPLRLLEPGAVGLMAIAEVVRVTYEQVGLRQVAGPGLPDTGNWAAFPF